MGIRFRKSNDDTVSPKKRDKNTYMKCEKKNLPKIGRFLFSS